ncbi:unnamed protein product, partial [Diamesa serratosioi]
LISEYSQQSSIHGIQYLGTGRSHWTMKIFWILALSVSIGGCSYLIYQTYSKWKNSPVIVSFNEKSTPVYEIPFPAITICPQSKFKPEYLNYIKLMNARPGDLTVEQKSNLEAIYQVCKTDYFNYRILSPKINESFTDILKRIAIPFNDTFLRCKWRGMKKNCEDLFTELITDEGVCYTFNMMKYQDFYKDTISDNLKYPKHNKSSDDWKFEDGYVNFNADVYPQRVLGSGHRAGLNIKLFVKEKALDYSCKGAVQGFKIALHTPGELPRLSVQFYQVPLKQQVLMTVSPQVITTAEGLKTYTPESRQCYFNSEKDLKFFKTYTQSNCELECLTDFTIRMCGCVKFSMPHDSNTLVCDRTKVECYHAAETKWMIQNFEEKELDKEQKKDIKNQCLCLPSCTSVKYEAEISQSKYYSLKFNKGTGYKIVKDEFQQSSVNINFRDYYFIESKRSELYGWIDFMANCGGLLGLFMGFSLLSLVEILYYFTINFAWRCCKKPDKPTHDDNDLLDA